ncbi:Ig-like domain-containing protein [Reinekea thalattae]|uniref:Alpha-2-macroglobulin family protein n=1 Tax=Reinekea thalattae TaxID=2593301 RepID=A0A5C8Z7Q7_9GAMM|nr:MG2 domain-containing protein [Reinekea thalattae]TXR53982.1 hypothetical protein FME95_05380 [Reinekea thalattae]
MSDKNEVVESEEHKDDSAEVSEVTSATKGGRAGKIVAGIAALIFVLIGALWFYIQYSQVQGLVSISSLESVDPDDGEIVLTYRKPVKTAKFNPRLTTVTDLDGNTVKAAYLSQLDKTKTIETIRFKTPTPYNQSLILKQKNPTKYTNLIYKLGIKPIPSSIEFSTPIEIVAIEDLLPTASQEHAPEVLNNQIGILFTGSVGTTYKKRVKLEPSDVPFIELSPMPSGYFQWQDDKTLTFNFTQQKPQFDTQYRVSINPEALINPDFQEWQGEQEITLTTSSNDVYVNDVSIDKEVEWNTPITFEFSGNMVNVFDLNKLKSNSVMPVLMRPLVDGHWRWINARTVEFKPSSDGWPVKQNVSIEFLPEVNTQQDRNWTDNRGLNSIEFYVEPRLQSISNINLRGDKVDPESELEIRFSRSLVNSDQLDTSHTLNEYANAPVKIEPAIQGSYRWSNGRTLIIESETPWSELTEYKVSIHPDFNPDPRFEWSGTKEFSFKTAENLITPRFYFIPEHAPSGAEFFGSKPQFAVEKSLQPEQSIWIEFNRPIGKRLKDVADIGDAIQIVPAVEGEYSWLSDRLLSFTPEVSWAPETDYSITLTNDLLYFHEQHYAEGSSVIEFEVPEDAVHLTTKEKVLPESDLSFVFNKDIDVSVSVGRRYESADLAAEFLPLTWQGNDIDYEFEWISQRELKLYAKPYWPADSELAFELNKNILPRPSAFFAKENARQIKTERNIVEPYSVSPVGKTSSYSTIEILFSKAIRPESIDTGGLDFTKLVSISPELDGKWFWQADNKLVFQPDGELAPSTDYLVTINPEKIASAEFSWFELDRSDKPEPYSFAFHSPYQRVVRSSSTFEFANDDPLKQRFLIDFELAEATTLAEVEKRFTLWTDNFVDGKSVEVPLIYQLTTEDTEDRARRFRVISEYIDRPNEDRLVNFQIERGVPAIGGNATMADHFNSDFLQEKPRFISIEDISWPREDGRFNASLKLNAPVEPSKLKQLMTVFDDDAGEALDYQVSVDANYSSDRQFAYLVEATFKPDTEYEFAIEQGLLAADGALTNADISDTSTTPNLERLVDFVNQGNLISRYDAQVLPIITSNMTNFNLYIDQIYPNNVRNYLNQGLNNYGSLDTAGKSVYTKNYKLADIYTEEANEDRTTTVGVNDEFITNVDLSDFFQDNRKGLYRVAVSGAGTKNYRWLLSTDIGLVARATADSVYVWTISLATGLPLPGVQVELVDYWNQTTSSGRSNSSGFVKLDNLSPEYTYTVLASRNDDFSFLDLRTHYESLNGFDVGGLISSEDAYLLQAYLYSERGVYRPGDDLHLVGVVRDQSGALPENDVVTLRLKDPTGSERLSERFTLDASGAVTIDYAIPTDAKTGKWSATVQWKNDVIGSVNYQVEEFIPNKIKVELEPQTPVAISGKLFEFDVQANNLFGPPASGRKVNAQVSLRPAYFKPSGYQDYEFGHDDYRFQQLNSDLLETRLDEDGHYRYEYQVPEGIDSPIGLNLHFSSTVIDDSGRGVAQYAQVPVHLYDQYVGVRRTNSSAIELGDTVVFDIANVRANGDKIAADAQSFVYQVYRKRKVTHYRKNERGYYRYVTERINVELQSQQSDSSRFEYLTEHSGEHYLQVTDLNGGQVTRYYFQVRGDRDAVSIVEAPESVVLTPRQQTSLVGDNLVVDVQAPFAGQLLLIAERDEVMWSQSVNMSSNSTTVRIPIKAEHVPNFYLSAVVVQPASKGTRAKPVYATGLLNINVRDLKQNPEVTISAPAKVSPNGQLTAELSIDELSNGDVYFTLAAVDEGILDLTQFKTPNMREAFVQKLRLKMAHFSLYPWVMPYESQQLKTITPSGSAPARALIKKKRENPDSSSRVKSVALWSGLQKFDADGTATVTFDIPEFDGSLRLMLVAFGDQRFNSAETTVTVRDDLVLKPSLPRFLATGDHFELPFNVFNSTELQGDVTITVEHSDHIALLGNASQTVTVAAGGEAEGRFSFNVQDDLGLADFKITAEGLNEKTIKHIQVPVRTSGNYISLSDGGVIDAATPKTIQIPDVFKTGTENQALSIAPAGMTEFAGSLQYLLQYPHGCLEQTTSKLFPLLYFEDFAKSADFVEFNTTTPRYLLREGVDKIERMQLENGYFSYWSGGESVNYYAFLYASHFMTEAKNKGLEVNEAVWNNMQYRLRESALNLYSRGSDYDGDYNLSHQVYALYVLALSGNPLVSEMNYLLEDKSKKLRLHDRARLAAAYHLAGREAQATELLSDITSLKEYDDSYTETSGSFGSNARDLAILLDALLEVNPESDAIPLVVDKLKGYRNSGRWGSTQNNAVALMALGKSIAKSAKTQQGDVIVTLANGDELVNQTVRLSTVDLLSGNVSVRTTGSAEANYFWQADGVSSNPVQADEDNGIRIRREFFNAKQEPVDLNNIRQGELVVVKLTMESLKDRLDNVAIVDLLPAGLEIENARLSTSADIQWLKSTAEIDHIDIRDDRMNLYMSLTEREVVYYYTTRAVTIGSFAIPAVRAEAMYDESKYSLSGQGSMKVLPAR